MQGRPIGVGVQPFQSRSPPPPFQVSGSHPVVCLGQVTRSGCARISGVCAPIQKLTGAPKLGMSAGISVSRQPSHTTVRESFRITAELARSAIPSIHRAGFGGCVRARAARNPRSETVDASGQHPRSPASPPVPALPASRGLKVTSRLLLLHTPPPRPDDVTPSPRPPRPLHHVTL